MAKKVAIFVFWIGWMIGLPTLGYDFYLKEIYADYPRIPDPTSERIVPHKVGSATVYVTRTQMNILDLVYIIEGISGSLVVLSIILERAQKK